MSKEHRGTYASQHPHRCMRPHLHLPLQHACVSRPASKHRSLASYKAAGLSLLAVLSIQTPLYAWCCAEVQHIHTPPPGCCQAPAKSDDSKTTSKTCILTLPCSYLDLYLITKHTWLYQSCYLQKLTRQTWCRPPPSQWLPQATQRTKATHDHCGW